MLSSEEGLAWPEKTYARLNRRHRGLAYGAMAELGPTQKSRRTTGKNEMKFIYGSN